MARIRDKLMLASLAVLAVGGYVLPLGNSPYAVHSPPHTTRVDTGMAGTPPTPSLTLDLNQKAQAEQAGALPELPVLHFEGAPKPSAAHVRAPWRKHHEKPADKARASEPMPAAPMEQDVLLEPEVPEHARGRMTWQVALQVVHALNAGHMNLTQAVRSMEEISMHSNDELQKREVQVLWLHEKAVEAASQQAQIAAGHVEELGRLTMAKANATAAVDLPLAAELQSNMNVAWSKLAAAHVRESQALEDADLLADAALALHLARVLEQEDLVTCLRMVSDAALAAAHQLNQQAQHLQQQAQQHTQQQQELSQQACETGTGVAVRQELSRLTAGALRKLQAASDALEYARSHFQEVWRKELMGAQEHALLEALSETTIGQLNDLTWRRDMALAADAYPEAEASQLTLARLQEVQHALIVEPAMEDKNATTGPMPQQQQQQPAATTHLIGHAGESDPKHREVLAQALKVARQRMQDYHEQLAAQRDASATLAQLELLRQQLVVGQVSPVEALQAVKSNQALLEQAS